MAGKVMEGPITIRGDLIVTGRLNKGLDTAQANNGKALQVIQGVLQPVVTQPNVVPASGDIRMYGQNTTINGNVVPGGTDGYFQIDEYINGAWQHLFETQPSTTGNANVLDLFNSGRIFARDSLLSAPGRFFFQVATPFSQSVIGLAYGNGIAVGVGTSGNIARSLDDGKSWGSLISNPFNATYNIRGVAYGNGVFVAVSQHGEIGRSTNNGASWSLVTSPFSTSGIWSIAYGGGVFVAVGSGGQIARSTDYGVTWGSLISNPTGSSYLNSVAYGNGTFVVVGGVIGGVAIRSTDLGVSWGSLVSNPFTAQANSIAYGNGVFVAIGWNTNAQIARSIDNGVTWSSLITNPFNANVGYGISFNSGYFLAVAYTNGGSGGQCSKSIDLGLTWGVQYGDNSYKSIFTSYAYCCVITPAGRAIIGGYDLSGRSIFYSDYVEAGAGIVESGSNSYGSWIKFSDGTMECWVTNLVAVGGTLSRTFTITWPMPFVDSNYTMAHSYYENSNGTGQYNTGSGWKTAGGMQYNMYVTDNTGVSYGDFFAIGRWK